MTGDGARASLDKGTGPAGTDTFPVAPVTGTERRPRSFQGCPGSEPLALERPRTDGEKWRGGAEEKKRNPPERKKGTPSTDKSFQMNLLPPNCLAPTPPVLPGNRGVLMPFQRED